MAFNFNELNVKRCFTALNSSAPAQAELQSANLIDRTNAFSRDLTEGNTHQSNQSV